MDQWMRDFLEHFGSLGVGVLMFLCWCDAVVLRRAADWQGPLGEVD